MKEMNISIDRSKCIKCGRCVKVCPSWIFKQDDPKTEVEIVNPGTCIVCGHCVAACPTDAVIHQEFPDEKVHRFDRKELPSPGQMKLLMNSRRSNRAFTGDPVPMEYLDMILEAAHRAPTASNQQQVAFTLVTDPEKIKMISSETINLFGKMAKRLEALKFALKPLIPGVYKYLKVFNRLTGEFDKGNDLILRGAKAVIFIHTPESSRFGCQDANLAYQNASLMAESLGVSQFYTGFVCTGINMDKKDTIAGKLGIEGKIRAGMALGMPDFRFSKYIDRQDIKVTKF